jgi:hypothetical protein
MPENELTVRTLAREVLTAVHPEELPGLDFYLDAYERDPSVLDRVGDRVEDSTAFAFGQDLHIPAVVLGVHFALTAMQRGVSDALEKLSKNTTSGVLGKIIARLRRKAPQHLVPEPAAPRMLVPEQLAAIREASLILYKRRLKMPRNEAEVMADALIGLLAIRLADPQP